LDVVEEFFELEVALFFVFDEGVALAVAAERDAFSEVLHVIDVIHPVTVDDGEVNVFF